MLTLSLSPSWVLRDRCRSESDAVMRRARLGDAQALDALVFRYRARIVNLCFQMLRDPDSAEDTAQEAFLHAFAHLGKFRGEADFGTWLYRVAVTQCLQHNKNLGRRQRIAPEGPHEDGEAGAVTRPGPDFRDKIEHRLLLESVLDALPEAQKTLLILREWHGLTYEDIASVLGIPLGTVRSRLSQARRQFARQWEASQL